MRITLLHNPEAGGGEHSGRELIRLIEQAGHSVAYQSTKEPEWSKVLEPPDDFVVAAGGDGTVDKVAFELAGHDVPLAILPLGTANNMARALNLAADPRELIAAWPEARRQPLDLGHVRGAAAAGGHELRFLETAGVGLFARWMQASQDLPSDDNPQQKLDRQLDGMRCTVERMSPLPCELRLDGEDLSGDYLLIEVLNIGFFGPGLQLATEADPGDGRLDLALLDEGGREAFGAALSKSDRSRISRTVSHHRGRVLELRVPRELIHIDGNLWDPSQERASHHRPVDLQISLEPHALDVLVPR